MRSNSDEARGHGPWGRHTVLRTPYYTMAGMTREDCLMREAWLGAVRHGYIQSLCPSRTQRSTLLAVFPRAFVICYVITRLRMRLG